MKSETMRKTAVEAVSGAFSLFSVVPMPQSTWTAGAPRFLLCAFPLVGAVLGGIMGLWCVLCAILGLPAVLRGAGLCLIPVLFTGGIHLDGYADTWDALSSHGDPEKRRRILKDPHLGAFAAIRLCGYLIGNFALWTALIRCPIRIVTLMLCVSRTLSALALVSFPLSGEEGLAAALAAGSDRRAMRGFLLILSAALLAALCAAGREGIAVSAAALGVFLYYRRMAAREFGGVSGDLAGWFLQTAEQGMLCSLCLAQYALACMEWEST